MNEAARRGVAFFGGAFNPPHLAHARIVDAALATLPIERLVVLPSGRHPWKQSSASQAPATARLELCRLAFAERALVEVSAYEVELTVPCWTVQTLRHFAALLPGVALFWLLGSDNWPTLDQWREHHEVLRLATVVTYPRAAAPCDAAALGTQDLTAVERQSLLANVLPRAPESASSSEVRRRLAAGEDATALLHPRVLARIRELRLYGT